MARYEREGEFEEMVCLRDGQRRRAHTSEVRPTHQPALRNSQRLADQGSSQLFALTRFENEFAGPAGIATVNRKIGLSGRSHGSGA